MLKYVNFTRGNEIEAGEDDLDGAIFGHDYRAQLVYVMTSRQIVSCKLDLRHSP